MDLDDIADEDDLYNWDEDTPDAVGSQYSGNYLDEYGEELIRKSDVDATKFNFLPNSDPKTETRAAFAKSISDLAEDYSEDTDSNVYDLQNLMKMEYIKDYNVERQGSDNTSDFMHDFDQEGSLYAYSPERVYEVSDSYTWDILEEEEGGSDLEDISYYENKIEDDEEIPGRFIDWLLSLIHI